MTDQAKDPAAAAERLRRLRNGEAEIFVYGASTQDGTFYLRNMDQRTLADAWLAEHAVDDGEMIDQNFIESTGCFVATDNRHFLVHRTGLVYYNKSYNWICFGASCTRTTITTRGQLRQLLRALGSEVDGE